MNQDEIINKIRDAGVVGAGGAGFPAHIKANNNVEYIIANGMECEPLLQTDQLIMTHHAKKIIKALECLIKITNAKKGFLALKKKYKKAIESFKTHLEDNINIELKLFDSFYPAGDEQTLVYETIGKIVPEKGIPLNVGVLVQNVGTLYNIYNALHDIPVIDKLITITGEVANPGLYYTGIGTPVCALLDKAQIKIKDYVVLDGGPLMGNLINPKQAVITKTTSGLIILPNNHPFIRLKTESINKSIKMAKTVCIQCNTCTENCPRNALGHNLKPHLLMRKIAFGEEFIDESFQDAYLCCECGICSYYACPMDLSPHKVIQHIKYNLQQKKFSTQSKPIHPEPHSFQAEKKIDTKKFLKRIDLSHYNLHPLPLIRKRYEADIVHIPLQQHIGKKAECIVKKDEKINRGQLIADITKNGIGAKIHASISGTVTNITKDFVEIKK